MHGRHDDQPHQCRMRDAARADAHHDPRIEQVRQRHHPRHRDENPNQQPIIPGQHMDDLLHRVDKTIKPAQQSGCRQGVAYREAIGEGLPPAGPEARQRDRHLIFGPQRFGHAPHEPGEDRRRDGCDHHENQPPRSKEQDDLADTGGEHRGGHEYHEGKAHHPGHGAPRVAIAHQRHRHHPRRRNGEPGGEPRHQQQGKAARRRGDQIGDHIGRKRKHQHRPPPIAIRERAMDQLGDAKAEQEHADHQLAIILHTDTKRIANRGQGGQHRIDAECGQRHQRRDQCHEFGKTDRRVGGGDHGLGRIHARGHARSPRYGRPRPGHKPSIY